MAKNTNHQELKRQALNSIAKSREELTIQASQLRHEISPARILQRFASRNATLLTGVALTGALTATLLLFRKKQPVALEPIQVVENPTPRPALKIIVLSAFGLLAKSAVPALIKSTLLPYILDLIVAKQPKHRFPEPPDHSKSQQAK